MKQYVVNAIGEDYKLWDYGDTILITTGTGSGKSYFIKNVLSQYCINDNKKILFLVNRLNLKNQIVKDTESNSAMFVTTYQKLETMILNKIPTDFLYEFDYIVCDEAHYFFTDSNFNRCTDLFFNWLVCNKNVCKIFMTSTARSLIIYFNHYNIDINYTYELKANYNYIKEIYMFNEYETIDGIIEDIPEDEQIIFFSRSAKRALEIAEKFNGAFVCSQYNIDYKDKINIEELTNIIENAQFSKQLLCATTALDNGINIKEGTPVKHIILDIFDRDTFIQCLGRKRIGYSEEITLYFKNPSNNTINGLMKKLNDTVERADFLLKNGKEEYIDKQYKNDAYINMRIVDLTQTKDDIELEINKCMYTKYKHDLALYKSLLDKKFLISFKSVIALNLDVSQDCIVDLEIYQKELSLMEFLDSIVGMKLYKDEQKVLIEKIGLTDARGRLQKSIGLLNEYFTENNFNYHIRSERKSIKIDSKVKKDSYWMIYKLTI